MFNTLQKLELKDYKYEAGNIKQTPCLNLIWEINTPGEKHEHKQVILVWCRYPNPNPNV